MSALPQVLRGGGRVRGWMAWLLPVAALMLLIGWETDWGRQIVRVPSTPPAAEPKPVTAAVLPDYEIDGGLPAHAETVQRTLFNATRRPAPVLAADDGPRQIARGKFQLMGTTVTGERSIAFLKEVGNGKTRVVRQGDDLDGMKVSLVTKDRVQFLAGDDSEELILKVAPGPKTTLAAAPPPPGAPIAGAGGAAAASAARAAQAARAQQVAPDNPAAVAQPPTSRAARRAARQGAAQGADGQTGASTGGGQGRAGGQRQR
jgi:hypothetical protein